MKNVMTFFFFLVFVLSVTACQPQTSEEVIEENQDSTFTLNGAGE